MKTELHSSTLCYNLIRLNQIATTRNYKHMRNINFILSLFLPLEWNFGGLQTRSA